MNRKRSGTIALLVGALFAVTFVPATIAAPPLGMGQVVVTAAEHSLSPTELAAFVPTSSHGLCQITLAEATFPIWGTTVFCGVREVDGVEGLVIHMFLPEAPPSDAFWIVNLYQENARRYGTPIACPNGVC